MTGPEPANPIERYWFNKAGEEYLLRCQMEAERDEALKKYASLGICYAAVLERCAELEKIINQI